MSQKGAQGAPLTRSNEGAMNRRSDLAQSRWSPWSEMSELRRQMDDLFSRAFGYTPLSSMISGESMNDPDVDIYETDDQIVVTAAVPGYTPEQIQVEATEDAILIQGERQPVYENDKAVQHRQSRAHGYNRFSVSYTLPKEIDPNRVNATFRNGILHLEMPKTEQARSRPVKINIDAGK